MIKNARNNRAQKNQDDKEELVHISKHLYEEISGVMYQKRKWTIIKLLI